MISIGHFIVTTTRTKSLPTGTLGCIVAIIGSTAHVRTDDGTFEVPIAWVRLAKDEDMDGRRVTRTRRKGA